MVGSKIQLLSTAIRKRVYRRKVYVIAFRRGLFIHAILVATTAFALLSQVYIASGKARYCFAEQLGLGQLHQTCKICQSFQLWECVEDRFGKTRFVATVKEVTEVFSAILECIDFWLFGS